MKAAILFIGFLLFSGSVAAQCVPDSTVTNNVPGIYPDSATGLPHAQVGIAYSTVIHLNVKTDTTVGGLPAHIDSINVTAVTGLPPGFTYTCTPSNCSFPSGTNACILLEGPALSSPGIYPIVVQFTVYGTVFGTPSSVNDNNDDYAIVVDPATGISSLERISFSTGQNLPNPAKVSTIVPVTMYQAGELTLTISNLIGKEVFSKKYLLNRGKSNLFIDLQGLQHGIYLYSVTDGTFSRTRRMIISNN